MSPRLTPRRIFFIFFSAALVSRVLLVLLTHGLDPKERYEPERVAMSIACRGLFGNPFRSFVHSPTAMDSLLTDLGFKLQSRVRTFAWEIAMYAR